MLGRTDSRARLLLLLCLFSAVATALGLRLVYWQLGQGPELRRLAEAQVARPVAADVERGAITDRDGAVLATTAYRDLLAAYPDLIRDDQRGTLARRLAVILDLGPRETGALVDRFESGVPYTVVARRLTEAQSEAVRAGLADGQLAALELEPHHARFYPNAGGSPGTTLASQLLGFVTEDGQGRYGIEQASHAVLAGQGGAIALAGAGAPLPARGAGVRLTIDASLQLRLEKELYAAWVADRAERVSGLVMDPYSGAILAWASVPGYDANSFNETADLAPELFVDPIASEIYEPGSVMKMLTAAAAFEQGLVAPETIVQDAKVLRIGPNEVRNFDRRSMGRMTFADAIAYSRNVATGNVAMALGETTDHASAVLYEMWQRLGIGRPTGIELTNEAAGLADDPAERHWQPIDLVNRAFGQAVAVTPLQLAQAFSAMVNGGYLPSAHLVAAVGDEPLPAPEPAQVLSPYLASTLRELMVHVVEAGPHYAQETLIPGYVVGGKTGTAQIWDSSAGQWMDNIYNHTFVGFVGAERPEAVILVRVHETEPRVERRWGMSLELTSNELFRRVALDVVSVLDIPPLEAPAADPGPTDRPVWR